MYSTWTRQHVVRAIAGSKGKPKISTPRTRETIDAIIVILTISNYVISLTNHPKFHYGMLRRLGWTDGCHITTLRLFYFILFLFLYYQLPRTHAQPNEATHTFVWWLKTRVLAKGRAFLGLVYTNRSSGRWEQKHPKLSVRNANSPLKIKQWITPTR